MLGDGDTTPPVIVTQASDYTIECNSTYIDSLLNWHSNYGGMVAIDNDSIASYEATLSSEAAVISFLSSQIDACINFAQVTVGYFALDTCGNSTVDTSYATFRVMDTERPVIQQSAQNILLSCDIDINDNLESWIDSLGGAVAIDSCSAVSWNEYIWADNQGNNGFSEFSDPINIPFDRTSCDWYIDVSFFASDDCGNRQPSIARLSILDTIAPEFIEIPLDITVACDSIPVVDSLIVTDYCDSIINYFPDEFDTRSNDPNSCDYYNYLIERVWRVSDACDNTLIHTQIIEVIDTIGPIISFEPELTISCSADTSGYEQFILVEDQCESVVQVVYEDEIVEGGCSSTFRRTYTASDVCGNSTVVSQLFNAIDNDAPVIVVAPQSLDIYCDTSIVYDNLVSSWVNILGFAEVIDACQNVDGFGAEIGSFGVSEPESYPGVAPSLDGVDFCSIRQEGLMFTKNVAFVFSDNCGNVVQTFSSINVFDTIAPIITNCPTALEIPLQGDDCVAETTLAFPDFEDNCLSNTMMINPSQSQTLASESPGDPASVIQPIIFQFTDINPNYLATANSELSIQFIGLDGNGPMEYYEILIEGSNYGQSPQVENECDNASMVITGINANTMLSWLNDGIVTVEFIPNNTPGSLSNTVNDVCSNSSIILDWNIPTIGQEGAQLFYNIDGSGQIQSNNQDSISVTLEEGTHQIEFIVEDCGGNIAFCTTEIEVIDNEPPTLLCPNDTIVYADLTCLHDYTLANGITYFDNCIAAGKISQSQPNQGPGFLSFELDQESEQFIASDKQYQFNIQNATERILENPQLRVEFAGNVEEVSSSIIDENGKTLIVLNEDNIQSCGDVGSILLDLSQEDFESWFQDDNIIFVFQSNDIPACGPIEEGFDNVSRLKLTFSYSDIQPDYLISGDTIIAGTIQDLLSPPNHILPVGEYDIEYTVFDATGNPGTCNYNLSIQDTISPSVACKDTTIFLQLDGVSAYSLESEELISLSEDNCGPTSLTTVPSEIDCNSIGTTVSVVTTILDESGNSNTCESLVQVLIEEITPTFSIGICQGDPLQLNANIPEPNQIDVLTFIWTGPSGFSSVNQNPVINNPTQLNEGIYTLTVIGLNGCSTVGTVEVEINQFQDPILSIDALQYCIGDEITLTSTNFGSNINYTWYEGIAPGLIEIAQTTDPILQLSPQEGGHVYSVIVSNNDCTSNTSNFIQIEVSEKPLTSVISPFVSVCQGETIQLESNASISAQYQFIWTGPNGYSGSGALPNAIFDASPVNQGTYILQIDNSGCLSDTATVQVIVFDRPSTPILSGENVLCEGGNFNISAQNIAGADQFTWLLNGVLFSTTNTSDLTIANANGSLSGNWQCYIEENLCTSDTSQVFVVSVESSLQVGVSNNSPVCVGDSVALNATFIPDATYTWTSPSGAIVNGQKPEVIAEEGEYVLNIITNSGCSIDESTFVNVTNAPIITAISNSAPNCESSTQSILFTPTVFPIGDYQYSWTGPNNFTSNLENPEIPNATIEQNGEYTLVVSIDGCDSEPQSTEVLIDNVPFQPSIINVVNTCEGEILQLSTDVESNGNTVYIWNTPNGVFETNTNLYFTPNIGTQNSGVYSVVVEDEDCQSIASSPILVEIVTTPTLPEIVVPSLACSGETIEMEVLQPLSGLTYTWTLPDGSQFEGINLVINDVGIQDIGNYTVQVSNGTCLNGDSVSDNLFVRSLPNPPAINSSDTIICISNSFNYEFCLSEDTFFNYDSIQIIDQLNDSIILSADLPCQSLDLSYSIESQIFIAAIGYSQSCSSMLSEVIQIEIEDDNVVSASFLEDSILICNEEIDPVLLNLSVDVDSLSVLINNNITTSLDTLFGVIQLDTIFDNTSMVLNSYTDNCGLVGTDTLVYTFYETFSTTDDIIVLGEVGSYTLDVLDNDQLPEDYNLSIVTNSTNLNPIVIDGMVEMDVPLDFIGNDQFTYSICSNTCQEVCDTATVLLIIGDETNCIVSNVLTPNGDGYNDSFRVPCLSSGAYPDHELIIFNRWGDEVYFAAPYENDWVAEYNGEPLPSGTYFYILTLNDDKQPLNGFIVVER